MPLLTFYINDLRPDRPWVRHAFSFLIPQPDPAKSNLKPMNRAAHIFKTAIRRSANRLGYDIVGHDGKNARWRMAQFFAQTRITTVFDVGANRGTYGWELREMGFGGAIVSFEPMQDAYAQLKMAAGNDPKWQVVNIGLGD